MKKDWPVNSLKRTLWIRQLNSFDYSIAESTSPLRAVTILPLVIFMNFRGPKALNDS